MKRHNKKTALLLASLLCVGMMGTGAVTAFAEETGDAPTEKADLSYAYTVGDLPYHTGYSKFGYYATGYADYVMKAGVFDSAAEGYGLTAFDTWEEGSNNLDKKERSENRKLEMDVWSKYQRRHRSESQSDGHYESGFQHLHPRRVDGTL